MDIAAAASGEKAAPKLLKTLQACALEALLIGMVVNTVATPV